MASSNNSLDTLIVKATNPLVDQPDPLDVASFCERVTHESDGPQVAVKLLAYRIHSPQEKEALNALALLEQCVKSCGPSFHSEIGKFRFLNELIKLVSPKYQAHRTPIHVKQRILEIIYTWTIDLKSEPKIHEAYDMLRKQGVIKENPSYTGSNTVQPISPAPREKIPFCDNSEKDALLQKLLKSKDPEDLQAANRLIKSMVREEENRIEAASRRQLEIETVNSNIRLLEELLDNFEANGATAEEMELCKELASNCDKLRPNLSKLATETDDKGDTLADILQTSDELSHALDRYEVLVRTMQQPIPPSQPQRASLDLLDLGPMVQPQPSPRSTLDDQLLLGLDDFAPLSPSINLLQPLKFECAGQTPQRTPDVKTTEEVTAKRGLEDLDVLGEALMKQNLPTSAKHQSSFQKPVERVPLNELARKKVQNEGNAIKENQTPNILFRSSNEEVRTPSAVTSPYIPIEFDLLMQNSLPATIKPSASPCVTTPPTEASTLPLLVPFAETAVKQLNVSVGTQPRQDSDVSMLDTGISSNENSIGGPAPSLSDVFLKLEDIKPSSKSPIALLTQDSGLNMSLHCASANVPKNVSVFVLSATSRSASPLTNFTFQAIVPKGNRVKLQPPSDNKLPAFNPFLPPPAITQVVLLSTAGLNLIELKYVVSFDMDGETNTEMGSVPNLNLCPDVV
ncbi:ADP-ribosylation factor-binding protein GGA1-like isoform X2 [Daphnia pulex]|uniref:ADP-ribosylation factor-binding protein GGA1-like isoform X2 n=1 Tax=Daphnia pulex TaxID=6669 RepID=UPI001EDD1704|nr:ADP-ribosylation factor-binding protein GGA1-like isoform X2 [Daphnia pulex]